MPLNAVLVIDPTCVPQPRVHTVNMDKANTLVNRATTKTQTIDIHEDGDSWFVELYTTAKGRDAGYTMVYSGRIKGSAYTAADAAYTALNAVRK